VDVQQPDNPAYFLRHPYGDHIVGAGILAVVASVTGFFAFQDLTPNARFIHIAITSIAGPLAIWLWRKGRRFKRQNGWFVCFEPDKMRINLFEYGTKIAPPRSGIDAFTIPAKDILWIRKSHKRGSTDDPDEYYVDLHLHYATWRNLKDFAAGYLPDYDPIQMMPNHVDLRFYSTDILRIGTKTKKWSEGLVEHWRTCGYTVVDDYFIEPDSDINATRQPDTDTR